MDSIAWKVGNAICGFVSDLEIGGVLGRACVEPLQFGYYFLVGFALVYAIAWILRPRSA